MLIKIIQSFITTGSVTHTPGDVVDIPDELADEWIAAGLSLPHEAEPETATLNRPTETATTRRARKNR